LDHIEWRFFSHQILQRTKKTEKFFNAELISAITQAEMSLKKANDDLERAGIYRVEFSSNRSIIYPIELGDIEHPWKEQRYCEVAPHQDRRAFDAMGVLTGIKQCGSLARADNQISDTSKKSCWIG
jgi:hypothetical protein